MEVDWDSARTEGDNLILSLGHITTRRHIAVIPRDVLQDGLRIDHVDDLVIAADSCRPAITRAIEQAIRRGQMRELVNICSGGGTLYQSWVEVPDFR